MISFIHLYQSQLYLAMFQQFIDKMPDIQLPNKSMQIFLSTVIAEIRRHFSFQSRKNMLYNHIVLIDLMLPFVLVSGVECHELQTIINNQVRVHSTHPTSQRQRLCHTNIFLDAPSHLYKRVCPSVRPSVRRSVGS